MIDEWTTKQIDKYILVNKKLGSGAFGTVYRGYRKDDESQLVAVKTIPITTIKDSAKMLELIKREIHILKNATHPNVVKLYDVARTPHYLYLFLEYCNDGDLKKYLSGKSGKRLSEFEAVVFLKHIVEGFRKLHSLKIIHRDIKPANILLHNGVAKITDFGFARVIETGMNDPSFFSRVGSPLYMAPQILEGQPFSSKCDVWSLGVMFYETLYGRTPWDGDSQYSLLCNIKKLPLKFPENPVRSEKIKTLLQNMLHVPEKDRFSWEQIFDHEVIKIQEDQIKLNMENLLKDKDDILKSAAMNRLYVQENLVTGYLKRLESVQDEIKTEQTLIKSDQISQEDIDEERGKQIINGYENETKRRNSILKYNSYFIFERNMAFFFNYVIQKLIKLMHGGSLKISKELYYQQMACISKNQNIHLKRIFDQLNCKLIEKFNQETWGRYLVSQEYKKILQLTQNDIKHTREFYDEILKKAQEVIIKITSISDSQKAKRFDEALNQDFSHNQQFQQLYQDIIQESIEKTKKVLQETQNLDQNDSPEKELLQLIWFLKICLNPYEEFSDINMDFNQFYEEVQNYKTSELLEKIKKKTQ